MRWQGRKQSDNIEDRRGSTGGGGGRRGGGLGIGGIVIVLIGYFVFDVDLSGVVGGMGTQTQSTAVSAQAPAQESQQEAELRQITSAVLASTEETWAAYFSQNGAHYREPKLVLYRGSTPTACGQGQAAIGPFYCPADEKVYLDLSFYDDMKNQLGAEGDFAFAYVIAHEVGHHVQHLLGINEKVARQQQRSSEKTANQLSVKQELQADCFAGVWTQQVQNQNWLEVGDIEEAMNAAAAVGDDRLQQRGQGYVVPDSFTHGTSAQRMQWFDRGFKSGNPDQCNTFG